MNKLTHSQIAALVQRAQTGDTAAFATLYAATVDAQLYFATTFLKDANLAEDAVQEVYLRLYESLHKLENPKLFVAYLHRICYNICVDFKKKAMRQKYELNEETLLIQQDKNLENNPDDRYVALEQSGEIYEAVGKLPELDRAAFLMRFLHNMKIHDIAEAMSVSDSTVKRHVKSAVTALQKAL